MNEYCRIPHLPSLGLRVPRRFRTTCLPLLDVDVAEWMFGCKLDLHLELVVDTREAVVVVAAVVAIGAGAVDLRIGEAEPLVLASHSCSIYGRPIVG